MTSSNGRAKQIRDRLLEFCSLMTLRYKNIEFDIDPFNPEYFHISCNGKEWDVDSIDKVMDERFLKGRSLNEIAEVVEIIDW